MRKSYSDIVEKGRILSGQLASPPRDTCGMFVLKGPLKDHLTIMVSDGSGWDLMGLAPPAWEHVAVSLGSRTPTWAEMQWVKQLFWEDTETVLEFHVPVAEHINIHDHVLHLWAPIGFNFPKPPSVTV